MQAFFSPGKKRAIENCWQYKQLAHSNQPTIIASPVGLGDDSAEDAHAREEQERAEDLPVAISTHPCHSTKKPLLI
jgi:hypothetical protein